MQGVVLLPWLTSLKFAILTQKRLEGSRLSSLRRSLLRRSLLRFSCLTSLATEVECFPVAGERLPMSLAWLTIKYFPKLRKLDREALHCLTYLQHFDIAHCPRLERLPEERLPPSLGSCKICGCPRLQKRCKPPKGKDWSQIHHIPEIWMYPTASAGILDTHYMLGSVAQNQLRRSTTSFHEFGLRTVAARVAPRVFASLYL